MSERHKIIARVQGLLSKTTDAGCTEDEAINAAAKAAEIMDKYELTRSELEVQQDRYGKNAKSFGTDRRMHEAGIFCSMAVAQYTECKCWRQGGKLIFFGAEQDTVFAHYLSDLIRNTMESEFKAYMRNERDGFTHGRTLRASFMRGMGSRVSRRLREMAKAREAEKFQQASVSNSKALVEVKRAMVARKFNQLGLNLGRAGRSYYNSHGGAHEAGRSAGERVNLSRGVNGGSPWAAIA